MNKNFLICEFKDSKIIAVPSIHHDPIFALKVREILLDPLFNIDCIAIELGGNISRFIVDWLKELKTEKGDKLPVLLGLFKPNNLIHPIFKEKVKNYQKKTKKDLCDLDPATLFYEFNFIDHKIISLLPMDSIIESVRCSIELNLPIYGIDLDYTTLPMSKSYIKIQDSQLSKDNFAEYVNYNSKILATDKDAVIIKREKVMATRLKKLADSYKEILFVCGLGHWCGIEELLKDDKIKKADILWEKENIKLKKIIIDKADAISLVNLFPKSIYEYENMRVPINTLNNFDCDPLKNFNYNLILEKALQKSFEKYFAFMKGNNKELNEFELINKFEVFLKYLDLFYLNKKISLNGITQTIKSFFQVEFLETFIDELINVPWADINQFPDLNIYETELNLEEIFKKVSDSLESTKPYESKKYKRPWRAWDNLLTFMSVKAMENSITYSVEEESTIISIDFQNGIDLKETIKSHIKGEEEIYVKTKTNNIKEFKKKGRDAFPVVWIFEPLKFQQGNYSAFSENINSFKNYIKNKKRFIEIMKVDGTQIISFMGFGKNYENNITKANSEINCIKYYGFIVFKPLCWGPPQNACWFENTSYNRNPIAYDDYIDTDLKSFLCRELKENCDVNLWDFNWEKTLMLIALGYAKEYITFVIPENFEIDPEVYKKAKEKNIKILINYLPKFHKKHKKRMRFCYILPVLEANNKFVYVLKYSSLLKENENDYFDLIPEYWRNYGKEKEVKI